MVAGRYFGFFALAVIGILALVWIEHQSAHPGAPYTVGYNMGSLPPFLLSAGGNGASVSGGPVTNPSASLVAIPDIQIPFGWN